MPPAHHRSSLPEHPATGLVVAVVSAAAFGGSGPFVKPLLEEGWSPAAAVAVRAGAAGAVLVPFAAAALRRRPTTFAVAWRQVLPFGAVAVAGTQLCYFGAIERLPVGVALLIEYLAPVVLVLFTWASSWRRPPAITLVGAVVAMAGLFLVLDLTGAVDIDPIGVAWGLGAAVCLACYFTLSARTGADALPTLALTAGGLLVGAVAVAVVGLVGLQPFDVATGSVDLLGSTVSWWVPMAIIVVVSTSFAYVSGVEAAARLGVRVASFVALVEVLFAVLLSWAVNDEVPTLLQAAGGILVVAGVVLVRLGHRDEADGADEALAPDNP